jgi:hypothetical protein
VASAALAVGCITLTAVKLLTRRAAVLLASFAMLAWALTSPAGASTTSYEAAPELGFLSTLALFVGVPVGLFLLIWLLVVAGQLSRRPKQENDLSWFREMVDDDDTDPGPQAIEQATRPAGQKPVSEPSAGSTKVTPTA